MKNKISEIERRNEGSYYTIHFVDGSKINYFIATQGSELTPDARQRVAESLKEGMIVEYEPITNGNHPPYSMEIRIVRQERPENPMLECNRLTNRTQLYVELAKLKKENEFERATELIGI